MSNSTALETTEAEILNFEVSDAALETAAGMRQEQAGARAFTVPSSIICIPLVTA
jgi:hypothetical protein